MIELKKCKSQESERAMRLRLTVEHADPSTAYGRCTLCTKGDE